MATGLTRAAVDDALNVLQSAAGATGNGTALVVLGWDGVLFQFTGSSPVGTITFEGTADGGTTWVSIEAYNIASGAVATTTTAVGDFVAVCSGLDSVRARISAFTSGTLTVKARAFPGATAAGLLGSATTQSGTWTVDTELPAAAALTDALANPTTPLVGAADLLWDTVGSQWVRKQSGNNSKSFATAILGLTPAQMLIDDSSASQQVKSARNVSDGSSGANTPTVAMMGTSLAGTAFDFWRNNLTNNSCGITASGVTSTQTGADQTNHNARGIHVTLDMTVIGTGSVTLEIDAKDPVSGKYYALLTGAAVVSNSTNTYKVYPGITAAANVSASDVLPRTWRIKVTANNANATTYTVGASLIV